MKRKNILICGLSTFPVNPENRNEHNISVKNEFTYKDNSGKCITVEGYYQLDPIPNLLFQSGVALDTIIVLATNAVRREVEVLTKYDLEQISALDYFKKSVKSYFQKAYPDSEAIEVKDIDISETDPAKGIYDVVNYLKENFDEENGHLYFDTHGGLRNTQLVVEAVMNLWATTKMDVFSVEFGKNRITLDKSVQIFDFVSGITEFLNYGRVESLERFLTKQNMDEFDEKLVRIIRTISEGIQWCNLTSFETGVRQLRNYYKLNSNNGNLYLQIFNDRIKKDYEKLFEKQDFDAADMAGWCLNKGFYQQALTILESRMGMAFENRKVYEISEDGSTFCENNKDFSNDNVSGVALNGCIMHFSIIPQSFWRDPHGKEDNRSKFNKCFRENQTDEVYEQKVLQIVNDEHYSIGSLVNSATTCKLKAGSYANCISLMPGIDVLGNTECNLLVIIFLMHKTIKDIRNKANHGMAQNPYEMQASKNAINFYLNCVEKISR